MKKLISLALAMTMALSLTACGGSGGASSTGVAASAAASSASSAASSEPAAEPVELFVFAAASLTESTDRIIASYTADHPEVTITPTYDSSGTLLKQIKEGAVCDLFISAAPKQINALDGTLKDDTDKNPDGLDMLAEGTRINLLENKVTLAVPEGNPGNVESFDQLAQRLLNDDVMLAMGNSDVPVGQYTQKIFAYYGIDEAAIATNLTYGSNVKEVTTQVSEGAVDCGIIYGTDAFSAGLTMVDEATAEMCGQVIYPAAVLKDSANPDAAAEFLNYLAAADGGAPVFESVGFTMVK